MYVDGIPVTVSLDRIIYIPKAVTVIEKSASSTVPVIASTIPTSGQLSTTTPTETRFGVQSTTRLLAGTVPEQGRREVGE